MAALGDLLSGIGGHGVDRPALEAFVANSQAQNGYRTAQTNEAVLNAQKMVEQAQARARLRQDLIEHGMKPSEAGVVSDASIAGLGDQFDKVEQALASSQNQGFRGTLGDQNADPNARLAAASGASGKLVSPFEQVPGEYVDVRNPGAGVQETPLNASLTGLHGAQANLAEQHAEHPEKFGGAAANMQLMQDPQRQAKLSAMLGAGFLGPTNLYAFSRNPVLIDSAYAAFQNDPTGVVGLSHAKQLAMNNLVNGQDHKNLVAANTAVQHLSMMPQVVDALNNGDVKFLNRVFNGLNAQDGAPAPQLAAQLSQYLGRELVSAVVANGGGEREREAAQSIYGSDNSPQGLLAAADQAKGLIAGRIKSVEQGFVGTMSIGQGDKEEAYRQQFRNANLLPETRRVLNMESDQDIAARDGVNVTGKPKAAKPTTPSAAAASPSAPVAPVSTPAPEAPGATPAPVTPPAAGAGTTPSGAAVATGTAAPPPITSVSGKPMIFNPATKQYEYQ